MADDLNIRATFDGKQAEKGLKDLGGEGEKSANRIADAYKRASKEVSSISSAVRQFQSMLGIFSQVSMAAFAVVELFQKARAAIEGAGRAADELADSARRAVEAANPAGGDLALFDALKESAEAAGVPAEELSAKLREFREHKITFDELAASVGKTGDALKDAAEKAGNWNVGRRYLADRARREEEEKAEKAGWKAERAGLKEIVREIVKSGGDSGNAPGADAWWDMLAQSAGGDEKQMREIFMANRSWRDRLAGTDANSGYGSISISGAAERYRIQGAASDRAREEAAAANDAAVTAAREDELDRQMRDFFEGLERVAEENAAAAAKRASALADAEGRRNDAAAGAESAAAKAREAVSVSAPAAISSLGEQGGLLGGRDPTVANMERLDRERNRKLDEIQKKLDETLAGIDRRFGETLEKLSE